MATPENKHIITWADTMTGHYLEAVLSEGHGPEARTVFHTGGTDEEENAEALNVEATRRMLEELESSPPANIVYQSSRLVYSPDAGESVDESRPALAVTAAGKAKAQTELLLEKWCATRGVTLTIVRPALMFGTGVDGWLLRLFNRVVRGHYVHIRGNDARTSLVTAYDVARAMVRLAGKPGVYNVSDGKAHRWIDVVEAMTANAGAQKRMTHLPEKWARFIYKWFGTLPIVKETLSPEALEPFGRTLVLDNTRAAAATGLKFYDTVEVIARRDKEYPYENR